MRSNVLSGENSFTLNLLTSFCILYAYVKLPYKMTRHRN
jgi:hypothetical protein